jgi:hypothetical protein
LVRHGSTGSGAAVVCFISGVVLPKEEENDADSGHCGEKHEAQHYEHYRAFLKIVPGDRADVRGPRIGALCLGCIL